METNQNTQTQNAVVTNEFVPIIAAWLRKWYN